MEEEREWIKLDDKLRTSSDSETKESISILAMITWMEKERSKWGNVIHHPPDYKSPLTSLSLSISVSFVSVRLSLESSKSACSCITLSSQPFDEA